MWAQFIQINSAFGSHRILRRIIFLKILLLIIASTQAVLISFFFFPIICKGIAKLFRCSFVCESLRFYYRNCVFDSRAVPTRIPANGVRHFQYCIGAREPSLTNEAYWIISLITFLTNKKKIERNRSERNTKLFSTLSLADGDVCAMWHGCRTAPSICNSILLFHV